MNLELPEQRRSERARAEAAAWVARLHGSERSAALEAGLRTWLKADPAHARAFETATEAWEIGGSIPRYLGHNVAETVPRQRALRFMLAAAILVVVLGCVTYLMLPAASITTDVGEQRMLTLLDGTRIFLNTRTSLSVREDATHRWVRLDSGEALFEVAKDPHRPFIVSVGGQEVVALGTSFVVRRDARQLSVMLVEGSVAVAPASSEATAEARGPHKSRDGEHVLVPGQRLTFANGDAPRFDQPEVERVTAWRRGEIVLDKTPLADAIEEMNRYSVVHLVLDSQRADSIRLSGIFRVGDSASFAHAVGASYGLSVVQEDRRIVISDRRTEN